MVKKPYRFTVDVESDWGGRSEETNGIQIGLPIILSLFRQYHVKGLFFISTELLSRLKSYVREIQREDHDIGSHGHFHIQYHDRWRGLQDKSISETFLIPYKLQETVAYRAPKFGLPLESEVYSDKKNHVGLLRYTWLKTKINPSTIFYMHPFDIVEHDDWAPNLFCMLWYSRPKEALKNLKFWLKEFK